MTYDDWKSTDPHNGPWMDREPRREIDREMPCSDCGCYIEMRGHSYPVTGKRFCDPCYRWRASLGVDGPFDPRSRQQLEAAQRKDVA